ncbi:hypothetical protein AAF712_016567, partial [Marasmius tenuissimus]
MAITAYHTSFTDFLQDSSRAGRFYIDRAAWHDHLARRWLRTLTRQVEANPEILLVQDTASPDPDVRRLLEEWVSFCFIDKLPAKEELLNDRDRLFQSILSTFPDRQELLATLASIILLPAHKSELMQFQVLNDFILGPDKVHMSSTIGLLTTCRLATPSDRIELVPVFYDFLRDPSQEYYIDIPEQQHRLARRWIQVLVPSNQPASKPDWGLRTLWVGWADFCRRIEHPSEGLLCDLQNLDLAFVAAVTSSIALVFDEPPSTVVHPFEILLSWLDLVDSPVPSTLINHLVETAKFFERWPEVQGKG